MRAYLDATRSPWYSFLFVLPLLVLYQGLALIANLGARERVLNGADAVLQMLLNGAGLHGWLASWLVLTVIVGVALYRTDPRARKTPVRRQYFPLVLAESAVYAVLFGSVVSYLTMLVLPQAGYLRIGGATTSFLQNLAASLGAGLYEELLFRLLIAGGATALLRWIGFRDWIAVSVAVLGSALLFSAFHYVGRYGDDFTATSFTFRAIAGVVLAGLYSWRGFAVAAWTHALYDVFLLLLGKA